MKIACILFAFNRPEHTKRLIESIHKCINKDEIDFVAYLDGHRSEADKIPCFEVQSIIKEEKNLFKHIQIQKFNQGLAASVISGVTAILAQYDGVIVLEDDLILSPYFFEYMKTCLHKYKDNKNIYSISGFNYPKNKMPIPTGYPFDTYFAYRPHSWGWATWSNRWSSAIWDIHPKLDVFTDVNSRNKFNRGGDDLTNMLALQLKNKINSWAIRWAYTHYKLNVLSVYPTHSLVENDGFDGSGTHCKGDKFEIDLSAAKSKFTFPPKVEIDPNMQSLFKNIFHAEKQNFFYRLKRFLKTLLKRNILMKAR